MARWWSVLGACGSAAALGLLGAVEAAADCGKTAQAVIQGQWQFRATTHYSGSVPPQFSIPQGHQGTASGLFLSTCAGPGACTLQLVNSPSDQLSFSSPDTGLFTSGTQSSFVQAGSDYVGTFRINGVGGANLPPCAPPREFLNQTMHIHVAVAKAGAAGTWQAVYITGFEDSFVTWTCNGATGVPGTGNHITFDAVPAGAAFPATQAALCPTPSVAPVASVGSGGGNPAVSTISSGLATPAASFTSLGHAVGNALITLGIVLLITFPASLFNKTFEENYDDIRSMLRRRFGWAASLASRMRAGEGRRRDAAVFAAVVLIGALIGGLNDPTFGFNAKSAKTYTAVVLAVLFGAAVSTVVAFVYRRLRRRETAARLSALPAGLLVAVLCVVTSRLTQFQPGYLYGVICGVAFSAQLRSDEEGQLVAIGSVVGLGLALIAWLAWVPVHEAADSGGAAALTVIAGDFLAAVFVGGLVGTVLGLVPLRFLPGGTLARWSRAAWAVLFAVAVFVLLQVMLRPQSTSAHTGTTAVVTAGILFVVFGAFSVGFRLYFTRRRHPAANPSAPGYDSSR